MFFTHILRAIGAGRRLQPAAAACAVGAACLLLTGLLSYTVYRSERGAWLQELEHQGEHWLAGLEHGLSEVDRTGTELASLLERLPAPARQRFRELAPTLVEHHGDWLAAAWLEPIEQPATQPDELSFQLAAATAKGHAPTAADHELPRRHAAALKRALQGPGSVLSNHWSTLGGGPGEARLLQLTPVQSATGSLAGFVAVSYDLERLLRRFAPDHGRYLTAHIFDITERPALLHGAGQIGAWSAPGQATVQPTDLRQLPHVTRALTVADRHWQIVLTPAPALLQRKHHWPPLLVAGLGVLLSLTLARYLLTRWRPLPPTRAVVSTGMAVRPGEPGQADYQALLADSPDLVVRAAIDGRLEYVSAASREILGREPETMRGRPVFDFMHPDDVFRSTAAYRDSLATPGIFHACYRMRHRDGRYIWLDICGRTVTGAEGLARSVLIVARDTSGRSSKLKALRESEALYRSTFDTTPQPTVLASADGRHLLRVNQAFCNLLGYSKPELRELGVDDITHPVDRGHDASLAVAAQQAQQGAFVYAKRYLRKDGATVWARLEATLVRDADGRPHYLICHVHDASERARGASERRPVHDGDRRTVYTGRSPEQQRAPRSTCRTPATVKSASTTKASATVSRWS